MGVDESHFFIGGPMDVPELSVLIFALLSLVLTAAQPELKNGTDKGGKVAVNWLFYFQGSNQYIA